MFAVANKDGILYMKAFGTYTYGDPAPVNGDNPQVMLNTKFDLARCATCPVCAPAVLNAAHARAV